MFAESLRLLDDVVLRVDKLCLAASKEAMEFQEDCKMAALETVAQSSITETRKLERHSQISGHMAPLIVCGPSGVGKGTLLKKLRDRYGNQLTDSVSHTTRAPRKGEVDGVDYHFVTKEEFDRIKFVERATYAGNSYGTSVSELKRVCRDQADPQVALFEVVIESAKKIVRVCRDEDILPPKVLFITTKGGLSVLKQRIIKRTELSGKAVDERDLEKRLKAAEQELKFAREDHELFTQVLYNDGPISETFAKLVAVVERWYPHLKPVISPEDLEDTKLDE